ncbi:hypothetical protein PHLGIDRAFT_509050 [Phlebiopsis gigantea 11061_1 CR5-6]|uniref:Uncharacterized protein n=1 Tax=Phlebiopsis gigantea (strain 11061_1 CR5-6) TaxID=745531 RepID=A0A0C3S098_PHLG1|nr:hypothetical protein PHLGIDRAFT_509050 [Phlebiopsis gigantea 11061_1 CR5-6]
MSGSQINLPKTTTLYSWEGDNDAAELEVPLQEKYTGTAHAIPNALANIPCAELGLDGLLQKLNEILETSYSFTVPEESIEEVAEDDDADEWSDVEDPYDDMFDLDAYPHPSALASILMPFVHKRKDFGTAYAYVRPWWPLLGTDPAHVRRQMLLCEMDDTSMRESALSQWAHQSAPTIDPPDAPPRRVALDPICGLAYLLRSRRLPPYVLAEGAEPAWARFLETVDARYRADLLFLFPAPGAPEAAAYRWAPGWGQVQAAVALPECEGIALAEEVWYDPSWHIFRHKGPRIDGVHIEGLSGSAQEEVRTGTIVVRDRTGVESRFAAQADHQQGIPDGQYLLQGSANYQFWVVGRIGPEVPSTREKGTVVKVSVLRLCEDEASRLESLAIAEVRATGFV